jgi:hypothetical protein
MKGPVFKETHFSNSMVFPEMNLQAPLAEYVVSHHRLTLLFHRSLNYRSELKTSSVAVLDSLHISRRPP